MANVVADTIAKMQGNGKAYFGADQATQQSLHDQNMALGSSIGAKYDSNSGAWDYSGVKMPEEQKGPVQVAVPTFQEGNKVDLTPLKNAIGSKPQEVFKLDQLKQYTDQATKYADPAGMQQLISQMVGVMQPLTNQQKSAAQTGFNTAQQGADSKWASRGLLASGAAAAQQQQGVNQLAGQMAGIEAQAQANAVPLAMNAANLDLSENQQKFGQLYQSLGMQQGQQQDYIHNIGQMQGMDIGQNQWAQGFGLQRQGQEFDMGMKNAQLGLQQDQFNKDFGLREGQLTGNYMNADAKKLFDQVIAAKQNFNGDQNSPQNIAAMAQANSARDQLSRMGINADQLFGSNVTLQDALKNFGSLGKTTLDKQRLDSQNGQWQNEFDFKTKTQWPEQVRQYNQNYSLDDWYKRSSITNDQSRIGLEDKRIGQEGQRIGLEQRRVVLAESQNGADQETQNAMADLANPDKFKTKEDALNYVKEQADMYRTKKVNVEKVMRMLDSLFPDTKKTFNIDDATGAAKK